MYTTFFQLFNVYFQIFSIANNAVINNFLNKIFMYFKLLS